MGERDGIIEPSMEAHCFACEIAALGLGRTKWEAKIELIQRGWVRLARRWYCGECYCAKFPSPPPPSNIDKEADDA